jgi:hypothetical protein
LRRHRRRNGEESVRTAYARHLRAQQQEGRPWTRGQFVRRVTDLEAGRPVAVRFWELRRFAPDLRLQSEDWVQLIGEEVVPVEPVRGVDGLHIIEWRPLA